MASSSSLPLSLLLLFFSLCSISDPCCAQTSSFRAKALVLPVVKDSATNQYVTTVAQRTPPVPLSLVLDIGGRYLWVDCDDGYVSSTYRPARCGSAECSLAQSKSCSTGSCSEPPRPGFCNNNTCDVSPGNPFVRVSSGGEVAVDTLTVASTDGSNPGRHVTARNFIFSCGPSLLLNGLANGAKGMIGLAKNKMGAPEQFAAAFSMRRKFAVCLSSSSSSSGAIFFGDGPYVFLPGIDVSTSLTYTPLLKNPVSTAGAYFQGEPSYEYFIGVKSIRVNGKRVALNSTLLSISSASNGGVGGTKISSVDPYTVLESTIYKAVADAFISERNLTRLASVAPFSTCFSSENIGATRVGPAVAPIDLVLQRESVYWRMWGANTVVSVNDKVMCLAFVDGGLNPRTSIVIGGYQLENNLVELDLATSRLGFSSSLLFRRTTCANFNFTSTAN